VDENERADLWRRLKSHDPEVRRQAQEDIVERYSEQLARLLQRRLGLSLRQRAGISDVAQNVWKSFFNKVERTEEARNVVGLLFRIAARKVADQAAKEQAQRRDIRKEVSADEDGAGDKPQATGKPGNTQARIYRRELTPEAEPDSAYERQDPYQSDSFFEDDVVKMLLLGADQSHALAFEELFELLDKHDTSRLSLRTVALRKLEGYSTEEIAEEMDCTTRNIQLRLRQIKDILEDEMEA